MPDYDIFDKFFEVREMWYIQSNQHSRLFSVWVVWRPLLKQAGDGFQGI